MNEITIKFSGEFYSEEEFDQLIVKIIEQAIDNNLLIIEKLDDKGADE